MEDLEKSINELNCINLSFLCKRYEQNRCRTEDLMERYQNGTLLYEEEMEKMTNAILENEEIAAVINSWIEDLHGNYVENHPEYTEEPLLFSWDSLRKNGYIKDGKHIDKEMFDAYIAKLSEVQEETLND